MKNLDLGTAAFLIALATLLVVAYNISLLGDNQWLPLVTNLVGFAAAVANFSSKKTNI